MITKFELSFVPILLKLINGISSGQFSLQNASTHASLLQFSVTNLYILALLQGLA